jgi:hypothetical protein
MGMGADRSQFMENVRSVLYLTNFPLLIDVADDTDR